MTISHQNISNQIQQKEPDSTSIATSIVNRAQRNRAQKYRNRSYMKQASNYSSFQKRTDNPIKGDPEEQGRRKSQESENAPIRPPGDQEARFRHKEAGGQGLRRKPSLNHNQTAFSVATSTMNKDGAKRYPKKQSLEKRQRQKQQEDETWNDSFFADPK